MSDTSMATNNVASQHTLNSPSPSQAYKMATKGQWTNIAMIVGGVALIVIAAVSVHHGVFLGPSLQTEVAFAAGGLYTMGTVGFCNKLVRNRQEYDREQLQNQACALDVRDAGYQNELEEERGYR